MNAQSEIDRIAQNVADTYSALEEKGATMPEEQNSDNLAATAWTVPQSGGSIEGAVLYTAQTLTEEQKTQARVNIGLNHYVTPQMYGAVADGITDDTAAFAEAIKHGRVYVPSGTYKIGSLSIDKTCHIFGESRQNTFIKADGISVSAYSCIIEQITVSSNTANTGSGIKFLKSSSGTICREMQVYGFNIGFDLTCKDYSVIIINLFDITASGYFAAFAIGSEEGSGQTNGIYLKRCYASACGVSGTDMTADATPGYGYGYYICGGYSVSIEDCIAEYCSGGGMYITATETRPLMGLRVSSAYFEENKIAQIYVAKSSHYAEMRIDEDYFISDGRASVNPGYKKSIYIESPGELVRNWNRRGYGNAKVAALSFDNIIEEAGYKHGSLLPVSALDFISQYCDKLDLVGCEITTDDNGATVLASTSGHFGFDNLFRWIAKENQVYELSFKYRRANNDSSEVKPFLYVEQNGKNITITAQNIAYTDGYNEYKHYFSFQAGGDATIKNYYMTSDENTKMLFKDFKVREVSFAKTYMGVVTYPQEGFLLYDLSDKKTKMYLDGSFVDLVQTSQGNDQESGGENNAVYGMYRTDQSTASDASVFSFGLTWAEVDKIVFDLYKVTNAGNNILFCGKSGPYIGYTSATADAFTFSSLTNGTANLSPAEITDGERHTVEFAFSSDSALEITNTWDRSWAKQTGYISVEFWKNGSLLKRFVPSVEDAYDSNNDGVPVKLVEYMLDEVSGEKIQATVRGRYTMETV